MKSSGSAEAKRPRCKYGEKCYRKNVEHRREFCHPTDADWEDAGKDDTASVGEGGESLELPQPVRVDSTMTGLSASTSRSERYCLDFGLMTQVRLSATGTGRRLIKRDEGMTLAQKHTQRYFTELLDFVKELENIFAQAEVELRLLGTEERMAIETQVDDILKGMQPALLEFLNLAVYCKDKESLRVINEVTALLGVHAERLGVASSLKDLRLNDTLEQLRLAYAQPAREAAGPTQWDLVRLMCRPQAVGPRCLLPCRLALVKTKQDHEARSRQHLQMRCQALLSQYEGDEDFCEQFRRGAVEVLGPALRRAAEQLQPEVVQAILRTAASWQCDVGTIAKPAGRMVESLVNSSCNSKLQPLARVIEVLDTGHAVADAARRPLQSLCDLSDSLPLISQKAIFAIESYVAGHSEDLDPRQMPTYVKQLVDLRTRLRDEALTSAFDEEFWRLFRPWYESITNESDDEQAGALRSGWITEWAIAYCEQLKVPLPSWMMNKDQVEALRKLQAAMETQTEKQLREAVIFAKQADYKSDPKLSALYDSAVGLLRKLKRLPSGWEVTDLVGDDATAKMFKKVNVDSPEVQALFQQVFDETKVSIVTRDRVGAVPRGYKVEKIISVMNAESWGSYLKRVDDIGEECKKFPGSAPCAASTWDKWSGQIMTQKRATEILNAVRLPPLSEKANEFLMFHGTKPDAAESIAQNHFDMAFACKTGLFGAGLYFAESCSKSDEYVKPDTENRFPVVICRVTLGHINYIPHKDPTTDPGRDKLESSCLSGEYHSVLGDRKKAKGTYREFIVYDHYQVYPHFIVWYKRL